MSDVVTPAPYQHGRNSRYREEFDRNRSFMVVKMFPYEGKQQLPGAQFDTGAVNTRRLRQLYDARYIRMAGPADELLILDPSKPRMPNFALMPEPDLRAWLRDNGAPPNPRATHPRLVGRAIRRWHVLNPEVKEPEGTNAVAD